VVHKLIVVNMRET